VDNEPEQPKFTLLPAPPGTCPQCARDHHYSQPHNWGSMHFQYWFFGQHGVWPTWGDAMAHCREDVRNNWSAVLTEKGVTDDQLMPAQRNTEIK
jgi:hypothetical protein